jgi:multiple sugar transport system ATP-binding protein
VTVYDLPANRFVGGFIGTPPMNFIEGQVQRTNGRRQVQVGEFIVTPHTSMERALAPYDGKVVVLGIRAENMETLNEPAEEALKATVLVVEPLGAQNLLTVRLGQDLIKVSTHPTFEVQPDAAVWLRFPADKTRWIDRDTGRALYPDVSQ